MSQHCRKMSAYRPNVSQHSPNMSKHSGNLSQHSADMSQHSSEMSQHSLGMSRYPSDLRPSPTGESLPRCAHPRLAHRLEHPPCSSFSFRATRDEGEAFNRPVVHRMNFILLAANAVMRRRSRPCFQRSMFVSP